MQKFMFRLIFSLTVGIIFTIGSSPVMAALPTPLHKSPALVISNDPLPPDLQSQLGPRFAKAPNAGSNDGTDIDDNGETVVGHKANELQNELSGLQARVAQTSNRLSSLDVTTKRQTADYQANVNDISAKLQAGTTPGNPHLVKKLAQARNNLEVVSGSVASLNAMAMDIASEKSTAKFLLQSIQAALRLSGAVDEDHVHLNNVKDRVNSALGGIDQMSGHINGDITHMTEYVSKEHQNLRALALGVQAGNISGKLPPDCLCDALPTPLADNSGMNNGDDLVTPNNSENGDMLPISLVPVTKNSMPDAGASKKDALTGPRPLAKIRFDRPDVAYEEPVYKAVREAMNRYPNARFQVVAVHPNTGNAAEVAIESTRARRDAEKVLRSLTEMGLPLNKIDLSYMPSAEATTDEVHLYVR